MSLPWLRPARAGPELFPRDHCWETTSEFQGDAAPTASCPASLSWDKWPVFRCKFSSVSDFQSQSSIKFLFFSLKKKFLLALRTKLGHLSQKWVLKKNTFSAFRESKACRLQVYQIKTSSCLSHQRSIPQERWPKCPFPQPCGTLFLCAEAREDMGEGHECTASWEMKVAHLVPPLRGHLGHLHPYPFLLEGDFKFILCDTHGNALTGILQLPSGISLSLHFLFTRPGSKQNCFCNQSYQ